MKIDMQVLKQLRDATLASLKDCREALIEANGDLDAAHKIIQKNGALKAAKKADRETNEGIVKFLAKDGKHVWLKLLCETDFVAKNDMFQSLVDAILEKLLQVDGNIASLDALDATIADSLHAMVADAIAKIGENLRLVDVYVHTANAYVYNHPGNKVVSVVYYDGEGEAAETAAKEVALQVAAMNPTYLSIDEVPAADKEAVVAGERDALIASGKPADMVEKILAGKMQKALSEYVLLEQEFIRDGSKKVKEILPAWVTVTKYIRWSV